MTYGNSYVTNEARITGTCCMIKYPQVIPEYIQAQPYFSHKTTLWSWPAAIAVHMWLAKASIFFGTWKDDFERWEELIDALVDWKSKNSKEHLHRKAAWLILFWKTGNGCSKSRQAVRYYSASCFSQAAETKFHHMHVFGSEFFWRTFSNV